MKLRNETSIIIDFPSSLHGYFLDYVINKHVIQSLTRNYDIFNDNGASHNTKNDLQYADESKIAVGHFSFNGTKYPKISDAKIVVIDYNHEYRFIAMVNEHHRVPFGKYDTGPEILNKRLGLLSTSTEIGIRSQLYTKLNIENNNYLRYVDKIDTPVIKFDYGAFFSYESFLSELQCLATQLHSSITEYAQLYSLYNKFIEKNQGYQYWNKTNKLIECIVRNEQMPIENNVFIHAYLNHKITKMFNIYGGAIFDSDVYPTNTHEIYTLINEITK